MRVKLTNTELNKLKSAAKNTTENFEEEKLLHELCLKTRQTTTIRNALANNMSTDVKLNKAQKLK